MSGAALAPVNEALAITGHPLQRAGAWAVAVMAGKESAAEVDAEALKLTADRIVDDVCRAATAPKGSAAYDWWKVLFALYPNSKATHSKRSGDASVLRPAIAEFFAAETLAAGGGRTCTFCGGAASVVWAKSNLPLFDSSKALNTLPPGTPGWPVCQGCRVAIWALPYGAWVTAGSATVLSCEVEDAERAFAERNVRRARRVMQLGFDGVHRLEAGARPELVALRAVRACRAELSASTLWTFKNDNQEPWLRVTSTRRAVPRFLAIVEGNAPLRRAWRLLEIWLTRRDKSGQVTGSGAGQAARLLFESEDGSGASFLYQVYRMLSDPKRPWYLRDEHEVLRLALTYTKEILGMEPDLHPVAELIADWIQYGGGSPRGKWAEYYSVSQNGYRLGLLLHQAQNRLLLDGRNVAAGPDHWRAVIGQRTGAWEHRLLLSPTVSQLLAQRGVRFNTPVSEEEEQQVRQAVDQAMLAGDEDAYDEANGPS
ncbi:hypothetical protein [Streptomyces sp. ODS05-4]|uniref:hypothetical protein n=1 Tax=Streptomyces sp. ODS05-4 TaxID=2944939 RepID=UPI002109CB56|nr:hypothetical protein [Streptomyces sp. ODS05-4]